MNLSKEHRKALNDHYDKMTEELRIFHATLMREGFSGEEAIYILCSVVNNLGNGVSRSELIRQNAENIERRRKILKELYQEKEKKDESI